MRVADIKRAQRSGPVLTLNIITPSGLGRYALQVCAPGSAPQLLIDARGLPRYWQSLAELRRALRRWGWGLHRRASYHWLWWYPRMKSLAVDSRTAVIQGRNLAQGGVAGIGQPHTD